MEDILIDFESPAPASRFMRWLASFIDYIIYALLTAGVSYFLGDSQIKTDGQSLIDGKDIMDVATIFIPWLLVIPGLETINKGQTIGKAFFRIKVTKPDGSKLDIASSIVRHLFDIIDFLPFAGILGLTTATNNKHGQRIGDLVAKTIVVDSRG